MRVLSGRIQSRDWENSLTVKCRFCGGAKCRRCSRQAALNKKDSPILGLHADWVAPNILGMMRPATKLMKEFEILNQFVEHNIKAVINVTIPGEHPYCGEGLEKSGFPYNPEDLMAKGIQFYNFGWEDMTVPTTAYMMNIVKVMVSILSTGENKIAVHCHAGYGRTGIAIAAVLMFMHEIHPEEAIKIVRTRRPGSIQTQKQEEFVYQFHKYLNDSKMTYAMSDIHEKFTLAEALEKQNRQLHGEAAIKYMFIPRVVEEFCSRIENFVIKDAENTVLSFIGHIPNEHIMAAKNPVVEWDRRVKIQASAAHRTLSLQFSSPTELNSAKMEINRGHWHRLDKICTEAQNCKAVRLLLDWLDHLKSPLIEPYIVSHCMTDYGTDGVIQCGKFESQPKGVLQTVQRIAKCYLKLYESKTQHSEAILTRATVSLMHVDVNNINEEVMKTYKLFTQHILTTWVAPKAIKIDVDKIRTLTAREPLPCYPPASCNATESIIEEESIQDNSLPVITPSNRRRHRMRPIRRK